MKTAEFNHTHAFRELESKALRLPRKARALLAQRLISSLEPKMGTAVDGLWLQEAECRLREFRSRKFIAIPAEKAIRKARAALR